MKNTGTSIKVLFFKETGKYYTEETIQIPDGSMQVFEILDWLQSNIRQHPGMYLTATLDELNQGYPILIPAGQRR